MESRDNCRLFILTKRGSFAQKTVETKSVSVELGGISVVNHIAISPATLCRHRRVAHYRLQARIDPSIDRTQLSAKANAKTPTPIPRY
jgi:hypothetical protein